MKEWLIIHQTKVYVGLFLFAIFIYVIFFKPEQEVQIKDNGNPVMLMEQHDQGQSMEKRDTPKDIMVDVKGAVETPGVYNAEQGERVIDLIKRAGGFTAEADSNQVNLSQHIQDEMVIFVPVLNEEHKSQIWSNTGSEGSLVNLNKASEAELQTLPGIGPSKALSIIEYRETNGGFQTIEDLKKISGIGEKTYEKLEPLITVN